PRLDVYNMYGGYLSLLLHHFGLAGVASGLGYSESRRARDLRRGGGPVSPGYYLPLVHSLVPQRLADEVVNVAGDAAACRCYPCEKAGAVQRLDDDGLMLHYLLAKDSERARVCSLPLDSLI